MKAGTRVLVVSFFLLASLFLFGISALADTTPEGYVYTTGTGGVTITGYTGTDVNLTVPATIGGQNVVAIGDSAFSGKATLKSISLPNSVLSLGDNAFYSCYALESLSLGSGLQTVGSKAFSKCYALTSLSFPDNVTAIGANAFDNDVALATVELPDNLGALSPELFLNCGELTGVTIPAGITSIGNSAFSGCAKLTGVTVPNGVTSIGNYAFKECKKLANVSLPASLCSIGWNAFYNCSSLTGISVPTGVTTIQTSTYEGCSSLLSVSLPDSVQSIGSYAFKGCANLTTINLPEGLTLIGFATFYNCEKLTNISLPSSLSTISDYAFKNCKKLMAMDIPLGVTSLGNAAFSGCSELSSVNLPSAGLTAIGADAFFGCSTLASINLPSAGLTAISDGMFSGCANLASISLPNSLTSIGKSAFEGCVKLPGVDIPDGVTSIGDYAFNRCNGLLSVDFPDSLASIGDYAFEDCANLRSVDLPVGATIGYYAFSRSGLTSLVIPDGMTTVGTRAFATCTCLTSIDLPDSLTSLGASVFANCINLPGIHLPSGLKSIGDYAFSYCASLKEIVLPDTMTSLGAKAFYSCDVLRKAVLPRSITSIGSQCFDYPYNPYYYIDIYVYDGSYAQQYFTTQCPGWTKTMGIWVQPESLTLGVESTYQLIYSATSKRGSDYTVEWTSSAPAVASVNQNGTVTAVFPGSATITAKLDGDAGLTAACQVEVKRYASGVTLDRTQLTLYAGTTFALTPTITPNDATDKTITWLSSDEAVATVTDGVVTAWKAGTATIEARIQYDWLSTNALCTVTVKQYATGVTLNKTDATVYTGGTVTLTATVSPADASDKGVTWSSSDNSVATVSASGVVTGVKVGSATITATAKDGSKKSAGCQITVWTSAASVTISPATEAMLKPGDQLMLTADEQPASAHDRSVTWSTNNASVARVDSGKVTAMARGKASITATAHNGKAATCTVTVEDRVADLTLGVKPEGTSIQNGAYTLSVNGTLEIITSVKPQGISHTLTFKSSDGKVATVSPTGLVKGLKNGQATITVTAKDTKSLASKSKTLKVSVFTPVASVSLPAEAQILAGATKKLTATIAPSSASDKALTWDSDNEAVATVAQDGTVTAKKMGTANITATSANSKAASCLVRVTDRATGVTITTATGKAYMDYKASLQLTATVSPGTAYGAVTWKSSNTDYVKVDATGKVYGRKVGKATVYATAADGSGVRGLVEIQVITPVTGVNLPETDKVFINETKKLAATLTPSSPTFKTLTWKSDNGAVATVATDGTVTAKALGTAIITATAYNGLNDSCTVTVAQPVTDITLMPENGNMVVYKGETMPLTETIMPVNASDKGVTWKSSNDKYARVDDQGQVTGRSPGKVKITATAKDGSGVAGSINLAIAIPATSIKLSKSSAVLYHNGATDALKTVKLTVAASPKGSVYRELTWSVFSGDAATVDASTGLVTAVKYGTAVIRATTDNGRTADCTVTVRTLPATFSLNTTEKTLAFKQSFDLGEEAAFDAGCTEKALTWTVKDKRIATVSSTGVVKASKDRTGTTTITAMTKNGKTAICKITVVKSLPKGATVTPAEEAAVPRIALKLTGGGYATSDDHVADVDGSGNVELKADGAATLEAGGKQIGVKVEDGNLSELKLDEGAGLQLTASADVRWTVEDREVVAVDEDGRLTALREGATTLTCKAENGGEWAVRLVVMQPDGDDPQPELEPSAEPELITPEPTPSPEPEAMPDATLSAEPESVPDPTLSPEPEPSSSAEETPVPEHSVGTTTEPVDATSQPGV